MILSRVIEIETFFERIEIWHVGFLLVIDFWINNFGFLGFLDIFDVWLLKYLGLFMEKLKQSPNKKIISWPLPKSTKKLLLTFAVPILYAFGMLSLFHCDIVLQTTLNSYCCCDLNTFAEIFPEKSAENIEQLKSRQKQFLNS